MRALILVMSIFFLIPCPVNSFAHDIDDDGKIGLAEAINALQIVAGMRFEDTPQLCNDGIDNDGDGKIDCVDDECSGMTCDDGNGCTQNDSCSAGVCQGVSVNCSDGLSCTIDVCSSTGASTYDCANTPMPERCIIAGTCYLDGSPNPTNECQVCDSQTNPEAWVNKIGVCDDGIFCNGTEVCIAGDCTNSTGNPCPGIDGDSNCSESCDESIDSCTAQDPDGSVCDDSNPPYITDRCQSGSCVGSTSCVDSEDCASGYYCSGNLCISQKTVGESCSNLTECLSSYCVDGVCCDTSCDSMCYSCVSASTGGIDGTCDFVTAGMDPEGECSGTETCNGSGRCNWGDGVQNGDETDYDCGGSCRPCTTGSSCLINDDCISSVCDGNICL